MFHGVAKGIMELNVELERQHGEASSVDLIIESGLLNAFFTSITMLTLCRKTKSRTCWMLFTRLESASECFWVNTSHYCEILTADSSNALIKIEKVF